MVSFVKKACSKHTVFDFDAEIQKICAVTVFILLIKGSGYSSGPVPMNNLLFVGTVPTNNSLFVGTSLHAKLVEFYNARVNILYGNQLRMDRFSQHKD